MTARSLREEYDDFNTLVMPTRPRIPVPSSTVIPIARGRDGRSSASIHPIRSSLEAMRDDASVVTARARSAVTTQASRHRTSEVKRYRRLSVVLAISLAFVLGIAGSLAVQMAVHFTPVTARSPRDGITRGESIQIFDGVEVKVASSPRVRRATSRSPATATPPSEATATTTLPDDGPPDLAGRDLLGEGLSSE